MTASAHQLDNILSEITFDVDNRNKICGRNVQNIDR